MPSDPLNAESKDPTVAAVKGFAAGGHGVEGRSLTSDGIVGASNSGIGVNGTSGAGPGAQGVSDDAVGVFGKCFGGNPGVTGQSAIGDGVLGISGTGVGVHGKGGQLAGLFEGDVTITGKLNHGGFDALQQISALKEQLSNLQNEVSAALDLIKGLANFDGTLQGRIAILEQQVAGLAASQANSN